MPSFTQTNEGRNIMARDLTQAMWEKFVQAITTTGPGKGLDPTQVMPTSGLVNADWQVMDITGLPSNSANPPAKGSTIVPALEQWANVMPEWSPNYVPSSNNFYDNYTAFLNAIELKGGNAALQQIADGYATNVATARNKLSKDQTDAMTAWGAFNTAQAAIPEPNRTTYAQWYQENWASTITSDQNDLAAQSTKYNQAIAAVGGPDYKTINGAQTRATLQAGSSGLDYNGLLYPAYTATTGLNDWYVSALQTLSDGSPPAIDIDIKLIDDDSASSAQSSYLDTAAAVSYSAFFWGGSAAASYGQSKGAQSYDSLVQGLEMKYTAQAAQLFSFGLGPWYDSAMVSGFYDQISPTSALANKELFGEGGFLNLRTSQVLVVLKPSVTITGDKTTISTLATQFSQHSSASVSVGAFCWSASASMAQGQSNYTNDVKVSSDGSAITITDNTNAPKVVLVVPTKLG